MTTNHEDYTLFRAAPSFLTNIVPCSSNFAKPGLSVSAQVAVSNSKTCNISSILTKNLYLSKHCPRSGRDQGPMMDMHPTGSTLPGSTGLGLLECFEPLTRVVGLR
jgi:hypothetical protein